MIEQPLFKNFSSKVYETILLSMIILMYICVCAEADISVPAFPQMINYFGIAENEIQLVLSLNFLGLCIAGIFAGPLADSFGRRPIILIGLFILMIASIIVAITSNFTTLLIWRFIQGMAASIPMVCAGAMLMDNYSGEKVSRLIGILNAVITAAMAGAPVLGAYISEEFNWRANFIIVMILAITVFFGFLLTVEESLAEKARKKFNLLSICKDYAKVMSSAKFLCYQSIANFPFIAILIYITNLSVIFVNHLNVSMSSYSYYQATTMGTFVIFSLSSVKLIAKFGLDFTKNLGLCITAIGSLSLLFTSIIDYQSVNFICLSMGLIAAGGSMLAGTFGMMTLTIFPEMNATAMAACTAIRLFLISVFVFATEIYFDGTIIPIAIIITGYSLFVGCFYSWLKFNHRKDSNEF